MAKREFIETREIVYVNAPIAPILQGDSVHYEDIAFKAQIGRIHSFSEQDIVKPYLDKIRAEIETKYGQCDICEYFEDYDYEENNISEYRPIGDIADILQIIDKYKSESEGK